MQRRRFNRKVKPVSPKMKRMIVKTVKDEMKPESKHWDLDTSYSIPIVPTIQPSVLTEIPQNALDDGRIGDVATLESLEVKFTIQNSVFPAPPLVTFTPVQVRVVIWQYFENVESYPLDLPNLSDILSNPTPTFTINSNYQLDVNTSYRILYDKVFFLSNFTQQILQQKIFIPGSKLRKKLQYIQSSSQLGRNQIYLSSFCNAASLSGAFIPLLILCSRVRYLDM